ncbi:hypothetical protein DL96DRAFT_1718150 [Flagelloscypha sp. PMI_526]|nr:hypothetical protein DL96DRAFT_1718150 [Flagelloscypha sp. PMI_526]
MVGRDEEEELVPLRQRRVRPYDDLHAQLEADPRFNPPTPSNYARLGVVFVIFFSFWLSIKLAPEVPIQVWNREGFYFGPFS